MVPSIFFPNRSSFPKKEKVDGLGPVVKTRIVMKTRIEIPLFIFSGTFRLIEPASVELSRSSFAAMHVGNEVMPQLERPKRS